MDFFQEKNFWTFNFPFIYTCSVQALYIDMYIHTPFYCLLFYIYVEKESIFGMKDDSSILPAAFERVKMNRDRGIQPRRVWIIYRGGRNRGTKQTFEPKITITETIFRNEFSAVKSIGILGRIVLFSMREQLNFFLDPKLQRMVEISKFPDATSDPPPIERGTFSFDKQFPRFLMVISRYRAGGIDYRKRNYDRERGGEGRGEARLNFKFSSHSI